MDIGEMAESLLTNSCINNLHKVLDKSEIESFARKCKFIERSSSRLSGSMFLELNVCYLKDRCESSLNDMCDYLADNYDTSLTKQSLDERFNTHSVKFVRGMFERVFATYLFSQEEFISLTPLCKYFTGIKLIDSTSFQLPSYLSAFYVSNGGDTSGASVKIHQCYDLLKGQITDLLIGDGKSNDTRYWSEGKLTINSQELHLADLGYSKLSHFQAISDAKAYFLTRYKVGTGLYQYNDEGVPEKFDIADYLRNNPEIEKEEISVLLGKKTLIPTRLFIEKTPESVKKERLKRCRTEQKKISINQPKHKTSENKKTLCGYNLFLTNAPALNMENVRAIYSLRWQIELLFKIWKSLFNIDKISSMSIFRFECYLYGRLIALLISDNLYSVLKQAFNEEVQIELSEWKTMKQIKKNS